MSPQYRLSLINSIPKHFLSQICSSFLTVKLLYFLSRLEFNMAVKGEVKSTTMAKQVKEKKVAKAAAPKEKKSTPSHPPYFQMIKEALLALKEKGGSSPYAIAKYMEEKHKEVLPKKFQEDVWCWLKNNVVKGTPVVKKQTVKKTEKKVKKVGTP
ncbi:hypothetical protein IFM89_016001 [Coptis chinensis]|uniref:H15 domain-containing protein n=1 Tax=Coptis chinensis TaxID=261450 RepID=A0A835ICU0_9MAGN|nr:hypothetical protein IFM89_016001 [Coptis chinensis]